MKAQCSICNADWLPECREHPVTITAHQANWYREGKRTPANERIEAAIARDPRLAERYGLEREP